MGQSQGQADAAVVQRQQAEISTGLAAIGVPGISQSITGFLQDLGSPGQEPKSVSDAFKTVSSEQNRNFDQQEKSAPLTEAQMAKQGGQQMDPGAVQYGSDYLVAGLEQQRKSAQRSLKTQETDASLAQRDFDISNLLGISQGGIGNSFGFTSAQLAYDQANNANPSAGALTGAASGAASGAAFGPWGALAGGVIGGAAGYFSQGGG